MLATLAQRLGLRRLSPTALDAPSKRAVRRARFALVALSVVATATATLVVLDMDPVPAFLAAAGVAIVVSVQLESRMLHGELRSARARSVDAADLERQRIQRDLHDGAQQRLISVRIHLGLLGERMDQRRNRETIEQLGQDVEDALAEIRSVTHDGTPQLLLQEGVAACLGSVAATAPLPVSVEAEGFGRYPLRLERNLYFCCLEALQNVVKHAGRSAAARIRLTRERGSIVFEVEDSGVGFDPSSVEPGEGLVNISARVDMLNGHLSIHSRPGMGTQVRGRIPVG
jgi:signal transduction histidine kinase